MPYSFKFKQFTIQQNTSAMKVGTDGVLLGAWSTIKEKNVLDIGTGTGLIALMIAQRNRTVLIDAIEIEKEAYNQALDNIKNSNWAARIITYHSSIQNFKPNKKYDLIISNPPFFVNSTKPLKNKRSIARHNDKLTFLDLIDSVNRLLNSEGVFSLILPINEANQFIELAETNGLMVNRECAVKPNSRKQAKRVLMELSFHQNNVLKEGLIIETETRHHYTKEYISLTQDFYLNF